MSSVLTWFVYNLLNKFGLDTQNLTFYIVGDIFSFVWFYFDKSFLIIPELLICPILYCWHEGNVSLHSFNNKVSDIIQKLPIHFFFISYHSLCWYGYSRWPEPWPMTVHGYQFSLRARSSRTAANLSTFSGFPNLRFERFHRQISLEYSGMIQNTV